MANLRENGATEAEIAFMLADFDTTRSLGRVELNAMTSPQFVEFVERKLRKASVEKIIPGQDLLAERYAALQRGQRLQEAIDNLDDDDDENIEAPDNLPQKVKEILKARPSLRWDAAVSEIIMAENKE
jgi:hypothetical protein